MTGRRSIFLIVAFLVVVAVGVALLRRPDATDRPIRVGNARFVFPLLAEEDVPDAIRFAPIGTFHTPFTTETGAPRQAGLSAETECEIRIAEPYRRGLQDLEKFEYVFVLYYFDLTRTWAPVISPPESHHRFGLFATRSPRRPNPIGLSVIKIRSVDIDRGIITIEGCDAFDGTPVLDIKPYLPSVDRIDSEKNRRTEAELGHHDQDTISDPSMYR